VAFEQRPKVGRWEVEVWTKGRAFQTEGTASAEALRWEPPCSGRACLGTVSRGENRRRWGWGIMRAEWPPGDSCKATGFLSEWRRASLENFDWRNSEIWFLSFFFLKYFPFYYYYLVLICVFIWLHWVLAVTLGIFVVAVGVSSFDTPTLERMDSVVVKHGLSSPVACGILVPHQGSNPCPLHWKADS